MESLQDIAKLLLDSQPHLILSTLEGEISRLQAELETKLGLHQL